MVPADGKISSIPSWRFNLERKKRPMETIHTSLLISAGGERRKPRQSWEGSSSAQIAEYLTKREGEFGREEGVSSWMEERY